MRKCLLLFLLIWIYSGAALKAREYHVSINGSDAADGSLTRPFRTISHAARIARAGDQVTVHAGVYRELISPLHGGVSDVKRITYRASPAEKVEIKGSEVVTGWQKVKDGIWKVTIPDAFFRDYNPYRDEIHGDWFFPFKGKHPHTGEVYLNGKSLPEVFDLHALAASGSWYCRNEGLQTAIYANFSGHDPNKELTEINVRPACFYPGRTGVNYITVKGFYMSQAATQWAAPTAEQIGLVGTNWSKGWIIEDNVIWNSKCAGITLGKDRASGHNVWSENMIQDGSVVYNQVIKRAIAGGWGKDNIGSHVVRNNTIFNCGAAGICGSLGAAFSQITGNHIYNIYADRSFYGAEMAGIKIHGAIDVLLSCNRVHNAFIGIWLDWMAQGTRVSENLLYDNAYVDFFPEVNHGPYLVEKNRFLSAFSLRDWSEGGIYRRNYFAGLVSCAAQERTTPVLKPHSTEVLGVKPALGGGNLFVANTFARIAGALPVRPKMHAFDKEDEWIGYGLVAYQDTGLPLTARRNKFKGCLSRAAQH